MERIIDRNGKKRRITIMAIPGILLLFVIGVLGYGFCIYNGYLLLNNPSKKQYPVSGIDLSHYQGEVDWPVLAQQNIMFAYIKATEGSSHTDARFAYNWEESGKTDLAAGAYHFFSFDSSGDTQADHFIHTVGNRSGMLPPAVDVEYYADKKSNPPDPESVREQLQIMLDRLEEYYHKPPVLYSTEDVWETYLKGHFDEYPLWIRNVVTKPDSQADWYFWQYTNRGRLNGYAGEETFIDLNVFYGDIESWNRWRH